MVHGGFNQSIQCIPCPCFQARAQAKAKTKDKKHKDKVSNLATSLGRIAVEGTSRQVVYYKRNYAGSETLTSSIKDKESSRA